MSLKHVNPVYFVYYFLSGSYQQVLETVVKSYLENDFNSNALIVYNERKTILLKEHAFLIGVRA